MDNEMKIPGFTAEASLNESSNRCRSLPIGRTRPEMDVVIPQIGGREFKGFGGCVSDCMDLHPEWSLEQCRQSCRDPLGGTDLGTSSSWINDFLTEAGIGAWELACGTLLHPVPCRKLANIIRLQS